MLLQVARIGVNLRLTKILTHEIIGARSGCQESGDSSTFLLNEKKCQALGPGKRVSTSFIYLASSTHLMTRCRSCWCEIVPSVKILTARAVLEEV